MKKLQNKRIIICNTFSLSSFHFSASPFARKPKPLRVPLDNKNKRGSPRGWKGPYNFSVGICKHDDKTPRGDWYVVLNTSRIDS